MSLRRPLVVRITLTILTAVMLAFQMLIPAFAEDQNFTFNPVADSYVNASSPGTNDGTKKTLRVDGSPVVNSYLRFNVSGLDGQAVSQARLLIHANSSTSQGLIVLSVQDETWSETDLDYSNAPATGAILATSTAVKRGRWVTLDVTSYVTGEGNYSFAVSTGGPTAISLSSRESGANAPQLVVSTNANPTPVVTDADTATPPPTDAGTVIDTTTPLPTATETPIDTTTSIPSLTGTPIDTTTSIPTATETLIDITTPLPPATGSAIITTTPIPTATAVDTPKGTGTPAPSGTPIASGIKHVFVVFMENHSYNDVWNTSSSPYITSLGNAYARATNYFAVTHPSLPNYLDTYAGSNYTITTDCDPSTSCHVDATNLADNLQAKGFTWKGYMESMPVNCGITTSGEYAPKHDPFVYFDDIRDDAARCDAGVVPYTVLASDLESASTTPNYAFITPNLCDDMHDCSISTGDTWLKNNLPAILNSPACTIDECLLALTWDEDDSSQNNNVLTIFAGSGAKTGGVVSSTPYTHYSLLRTVEMIFGLPAQTSNDSAASPMLDLLR